MRAFVLRLAEKLLRSALFGNNALVDKDNSVRYITRKGHLVRYDNHRQALLCQIADNAQNLANHLRIKRTRRLVHEQHLRLQRQRTCNRHTLLLTTAELMRLSIDIAVHANMLQIFQRCFLRFFLALAQHLHLTNHAVFQNRHVIEEIEGLEHHAHLRAVHGQLFEGFVDVLTTIINMTVSRMLKIVYAANQGRLAAAGRTDNADNIAAMHIEADALQNLTLAKAFL